MLSIIKPSDAKIRRFLEGQRALPFTYTEVGASRGSAPPGYPINHYRRKIGTGEDAYRRAVEALRGWKMYDLAWTRLCWPEAPIAPGSSVVVVAGSLGLWSLNACRIIYTIDEHGAFSRYGFAFGTLPGHVEQGEERFTVEWRRDDDSVWYELFTFARARHPLAKLGYPVTRLVQKWFARASAEAMQRATSSEASL
jgi:uncharacterized protein (UPF0548 family)